MNSCLQLKKKGEALVSKIIAFKEEFSTNKIVCIDTGEKITECIDDYDSLRKQIIKEHIQGKKLYIFLPSIFDYHPLSPRSLFSFTDLLDFTEPIIEVIRDDFEDFADNIDKK